MAAMAHIWQGLLTTDSGKNAAWRNAWRAMAARVHCCPSQELHSRSQARPYCLARHAPNPQSGCSRPRQVQCWRLTCFRVQPCLCQGHVHLEHVDGRAALEAALPHARSQVGDPPRGLEGAQQRAFALMPDQVGDVLVCLGAVPGDQAGQAEAGGDFMGLLDCG